MKWVILFSTLALAGCANTPAGTPQASPKAVDLGCKALPLLDLTFRAFGSQIGVTAEQMGWEIGVVRTLTAACASRSSGSEAAIVAGINALADFLTQNGVNPALPKAPSDR